MVICSYSTFTSAIPGILTGDCLAMGRIVAESALPYYLQPRGSVAILPTNILVIY